MPVYGTPDSTVGTWVIGVDANRITNGMMKQNVIAQNNAIGWNVTLSAGTWELTTVYTKASTIGIAAITLGGASIGSLDGYNASTSYNQVSVIGAISVAATAKLSLLYTLSTKNASSTNFDFQPSQISLRRTA